MKRRVLWWLAPVGLVGFIFAVGLGLAKTIQLPPDNALARLKPGPGLDVVERNCGLCHSTDYIVRQPRSDARHWEAEVRKMGTTYGAVLTDEEVKTIVQYLASSYGPSPRKGGKDGVQRK